MGQRRTMRSTFTWGGSPSNPVDSKLSSLRFSSCDRTGLYFKRSPDYPNPLIFNCSYVSNSDLAMAIWNTIAPNLRHLRESSQAISLKTVWIRLLKQRLTWSFERSNLRLGGQGSEVFRSQLHACWWILSAMLLPS